MPQLVVDNIFTHVINISEADKHAIYNALSYQVKDYKQVARRMAKTNPAMRNWNGIKSFYDGRSKRFMTGFLPRVVGHLKRLGLNYEIIEKRRPATQFPDVPLTLLDGMEFYDHQSRSINSSLAGRRGVVKIATGGGKTECAAAFIAMTGKPTIFLTHRVNLLSQTAKRFSKRLPHLKKKIGLIGDGHYSPNVITLATVQTLHSMAKKDMKATLELLGQFEVLIIDEAHRSGSKTFYEVASMCHNADIRLALTATPFMKGNEEEDMWLEAITGHIIANVTAGELIEAGILAKPFFRFIPVDTPMERHYTNWRDIYENGIVNNVARNKIIVQQTMKLVEMGKKTLVIVQEIKHGMILEDVMKAMGVRARFVSGSTDSSDRDKAIAHLEKGKLDILIATNIFDEGIDVGELGAVVLGAGCKSAPALFQRTGRAVRRKEDENYAIIVDFIDNHHPKLLEHSMKRYEMIKNEPGFVII